MAGGYDGEIKINTRIDANNASSQILTLENRMAKLASKIDGLKSKMEALGNSQIPTEEYAGLQKELDKARDSLIKLLEKQERFLSTGGEMDSQAYKNMEFDVNSLRDKITEATAALQELENSGNAFTLGSDTAEYSDLASKIALANGDMKALVKRHDELIAKSKQAGATGKKAMNDIGKGAKQASGQTKGLVTSLKGGIATLLKYALGMKAVTGVFRVLKDLLKEGLENLAQYSSTYNATMSGFTSATATLKNSLATLAEPILNLIIPALTTMINWVISAINAFNQLMAVLGGKSTWTRAVTQQKDYAKSLKGTASGAKEASTALAKFDDLDVLKHNDSSGGGGGAGELTGADAFEEVPIDKSKWDWIDDVKDRLKALWDIFKDGFKYGLGDWETRWADLLQGIERIKNALVEIFTDPEVLASMNRWLDSFVFMLGTLAGAAASIALTIATALIGGLGIYMMEHTEEIKSYLISMFDIGTEINYLIADFAAAFANVFSAFAGENGQEVVANLIAIFATCFATITELAARLGRDILTFMFQPFIDNQEGFKAAIDGTLGVLSTALEAIKNVLEPLGQYLISIYDEHIKPLFDNTTESISAFVEMLLAFYNETFLPFMQGIIEQLQPFLETYIVPMFTALFDFIGSLAELLNFLLNTVLIPLISWLVANLLPVILPIIQTIINVVKTVLITISTVVTTILKLLKSVIDFVVDVFTVGWDEAWNKLKDTWASIWDTMLEKVTAIVNAIIDIINSLIETVESAVNAILSMVDSIPVIGDIAGELGMPSSVSFGNIPHLAGGGVTSGATLAEIGEAGREAVLPLEQDTSWMDELAQRINGNNSGNGTAIMELDGETFARLIVPYTQGESVRTGVRLSTV